MNLKNTKWPEQRLTNIKPWIRFSLACLFLNVVFNIQYPAPEASVFTLVQISPEALGIVAAVSTAAWLGVPFHPTIYLPLTACILFMRLFRIGEVLIPIYFFRPFNLYLDSQFLPDLIYLLYSTLSTGAFAFFAGLAVASIVGFTTVTWAALRCIHLYLRATRKRCFLAVMLVNGLLLLQISPAGGFLRHSNIAAQSYFHRIIEEVDFILQIKGYRARFQKDIDQAIEKSRRTNAALDKLDGANFYILFIESYGHTLFADERHFAKISPVLNTLAGDLEQRGFAMVSTFFNSTTYGGASWLAHATLASGVHLNNQMRYNLLITSKAKTIAHYFNQAGYRTVSVKPGTKWPWPEGEFFGFHKKYYAWHFNYQGPPHGWSSMPDQYVLDYIYRREIKHGQKPLFIEFALISSHAPFNGLPPFVADWSQIGDGAVFHELETIYFPVNWHNLTDASDAYVAAIIYELRVIGDFIKQFVDDNALVLILGDHQPVVQITGANQPWSVPVHVICRNRDFVKLFEQRGFTPGLIPRQISPHAGMETFLYNFLKDFSSP